MPAQVEMEFSVPVGKHSSVSASEALDKGQHYRRLGGDQVIAGTASGRRNPLELGVHGSLSSISRAAIAGETTERTHRHCLSQPEGLSITKRMPPAQWLGMQTLSLSSNGKNGQLLDSKTSMRLRAFRFLSDRFAQRERPSVAAEYFLFALIVIMSTWSIASLAHAMRLNM
jgi:hypothetical protein